MSLENCVYSYVKSVYFKSERHQTISYTENNEAKDFYNFWQEFLKEIQYEFLNKHHISNIEIDEYEKHLNKLKEEEDEELQSLPEELRDQIDKFKEAANKVLKEKYATPSTSDREKFNIKQFEEFNAKISTVSEFFMLAQPNPIPLYCGEIAPVDWYYGLFTLKELQDALEKHDSPFPTKYFLTFKEIDSITLGKSKKELVKFIPVNKDIVDKYLKTILNTKEKS